MIEEKNEVVEYLKGDYDFATTFLTREKKDFKITLQEWFDGVGYKVDNSQNIHRDLLNTTFHGVSEISAFDVTKLELTSLEVLQMKSNLNSDWLLKVNNLDKELKYKDIIEINKLIISFNTTKVDDIAVKNVDQTISLLSRWIIAKEAEIREISTHMDKFGESFDPEKALLELRSMERNVSLEEWPNVARSLGKFVYQYKK